MPFTTSLSRAGYALSQPVSFWIQPGYAGIAYSDGDETEQRLAAILASAADLSVFSWELASQWTDWASLYHLSGSRANLLRPFRERLEQAEVLEVGAGCGAITRYLGECGARVLALEGSPRRAAMARSRTRDLANVTVVADRFDQFVCDQRFDVVTLIGVLEYAAQFTEGAEPAVRMLERVRGLLKPGGKLIVAIENQLGLKYFAGAAEDHLNEPMVGIEGRYGEKGPRTFGRAALAGVLRRAGLTSLQFLAPFPDYKLPVSIVTERALSCAGFDAAAFAWQSARRDFQLPRHLAFAPELAWPEVAANGLTLDLANSFLVVAGTADEPFADPTVLAFHYSTNHRLAAYCKETRFCLQGNRVEVRYQPLGEGAAVESRRVRFCVPERANYVSGSPLSSELMAIVTRDGWRMEEVGGFLRRYLAIVEALASTPERSLRVTSLATPVPGEYFDAVPQNILIDPDGQWHLIDHEWDLTEPFPAGWLLYRALLLLIMSLTRLHQGKSDFAPTRAGFMLAALEAAGFAADEELLLHYGRLEIQVQAEIEGEAEPDCTRWGPEEPLPQRVLLHEVAADRERQIALLHGHIHGLIQDAERKEREVASEAARAARGKAREINFWRRQLRRTEHNISVIRRNQARNLFIRGAQALGRFNVRRSLECRRLRRLLQTQPLLDAAWYLQQYPDVGRMQLDPVQHYVFFGADDERNPNPYFDTQWYLETFPEVDRMGMNPLLHYLQHGPEEGMDPNPYFDTRWYRQAYPQAESEGLHPLVHYIEHGCRGETNPNPYFDTGWYRRVYSDIAENDLDPLLHYILHGFHEERNPGPHFHACWYLEQYPDVAASGEDPLLHFLWQGERQGCNPNPWFDTRWYRQQYLEGYGEDEPPLLHFLLTGVHQGNRPHPDLNGEDYLRRIESAGRAAG